jgi:hypothetical protein
VRPKDVDELRGIVVQAVPGLVAAIERDDDDGFAFLLTQLVEEAQGKGFDSCSVSWALVAILSAYGAFLLDQLSSATDASPALISMMVGWNHA